jgi:hypothetical protein
MKISLKEQTMGRRNRSIGKAVGILRMVPDDMRRYAAKTIGKLVIMGCLNMSGWIMYAAQPLAVLSGHGKKCGSWLVGPRIAAIAVHQPAFSVIGTPSSQASQLPQWIEWAVKTVCKKTPRTSRGVFHSAFADQA